MISGSHTEAPRLQSHSHLSPLVLYQQHKRASQKNVLGSELNTLLETSLKELTISDKKDIACTQKAK